MTLYPVNFPFFLLKKKTLASPWRGSLPKFPHVHLSGQTAIYPDPSRLVHLIFPTGRARVFGCCPARARRPMRIPFPVTPHGATEKPSAPLLRRACRKFSHARSLPPPPLSLSLSPYSLLWSFLVLYGFINWRWISSRYSFMGGVGKKVCN
jgi:hypothetical protein